MSDNWEDECKVVPKGDKWEGEDEDDDVKDNWDDEEEAKETEPEVNRKVVQISDKKRKAMKIAQKDNKERIELKPKTLEEELADKLERQRLQEESDLLLAKEAFGETDSTKSVGSGLDISLNTKEDFDVFKKGLVDKLIVYDKSPHFVNFLESLFRELCVSIESDDIKRLSGSLTALFNEKVKAQKLGSKGKRKGKGYSVRVERNDVDYDMANNDNMEDFEDFI